MGNLVVVVPVRKYANISSPSGVVISEPSSSGAGISSTWLGSSGSCMAMTTSPYGFIHGGANMPGGFNPAFRTTILKVVARVYSANLSMPISYINMYICT